MAGCGKALAVVSHGHHAGEAWLRCCTSADTRVSWTQGQGAATAAPGRVGRAVHLPGPAYSAGRPRAAGVRWSLLSAAETEGGELVLRAYYVAQSPRASLLWVYRRRSAEKPVWFLQRMYGQCQYWVQMPYWSRSFFCSTLIAFFDKASISLAALVRLASSPA